MTAPRTCRLVTLGCKVNQYETQYVKETLEANGYVEAAEGQPADLCIVNTCTVTVVYARRDQVIRGRLAHATIRNSTEEGVVIGGIKCSKLSGASRSSRRSSRGMKRLRENSLRPAMVKLLRRRNPKRDPSIVPAENMVNPSVLLLRRLSSSFRKKIDRPKSRGAAPSFLPAGKKQGPRPNGRGPEMDRGWRR